MNAWFALDWWAGGRAVVAAGVALAAAVALLILAQADLWTRNGLWADEYFSLWATDPDAGLFTLLSQRILPDSNTPLYFTALALFRPLIENERAVFIAVNTVALLLAALAVWRIGARAGLRATALSCLALFLISGATLCYLPEGRPYFSAMCAALAIAFAAATAVETDPGPRPWLTFALLGALAALTHVFAALFAGVFAAGMVLEGWLQRRPALARAGFALGASASLVIFIWFVFARDSAGNLAWIEFTAAAVRDAVWFVRALTFGSNLVALAFFAFLAWSATRPALHPLLRVFAVSSALFIVLPLMVSFVFPLIVGRYWLIGAPAAAVLAAFAVRAHLLAAAGGAARAPAIAAAFGVVVMLAASVLGAGAAQRFTESKPTWRGVEVAHRLAPGCPPGAIHVRGQPSRYALAAHVPADRFVDATVPAAALLDARTARCPLLGWAEHVLGYSAGLPEASDAELLAMVKVAGEPGRDVDVVRHSSGFVAMRAD